MSSLLSPLLGAVHPEMVARVAAAGKGSMREATGDLEQARDLALARGLAVTEVEVVVMVGGIGLLAWVAEGLVEEGSVAAAVVEL